MKTVVSGPTALANVDAALTHVVGPGLWVDRIGGIVAIADTGSDNPGDVIIVKPGGNIYNVGQRGLSPVGIGWSYDGYVMLSSADGTRRVTIPNLGQVDFDNSYQSYKSFAALSDRYIRFNGWQVIAGDSTVEAEIYTSPSGGNIANPSAETAGGAAGSSWSQAITRMSGTPFNRVSSGVGGMPSAGSWFWGAGSVGGGSAAASFYKIGHGQEGPASASITQSVNFNTLYSIAIDYSITGSWTGTYNLVPAGDGTPGFVWSLSIYADAALLGTFPTSGTGTLTVDTSAITGTKTLSIKFNGVVDPWTIVSGDFFVVPGVPGSIPGAGLDNIQENTQLPENGSIFPYKLTGGDSLWWLADRVRGTLTLYDAVAKAEVANSRSSFYLASLGDIPAVCPSYSQKHGVFAFIDSTPELNIAANVNTAFTVATPTFSATPNPGGQRTVTTTVLGDNSEPCTNRVVTFSATVGTFHPASVLTNASGVATTIWRAPNADSAGETLTATLTE